MRKVLLAGSTLMLLGGLALAPAANAAMVAKPGDAGHMSATAALPYNASAETYLQIAEKAVAAHQKTRAHEALGRAETVLLTNSYPAGSVSGPISTPAITAIRDARSAVEQGDYNHAARMITHALKEVHGHGTM